MALKKVFTCATSRPIMLISERCEGRPPLVGGYLVKRQESNNAFSHYLSLLDYRMGEKNKFFKRQLIRLNKHNWLQGRHFNVTPKRQLDKPKKNDYSLFKFNSFKPIRLILSINKTIIQLIMPGKSKFQISRSLDERIKRIIIGGTSEHDSEFSQVNSAFILGFNYGNVTNCVGLTTNYQLHHAVFPVVGLVFFKSSPTDDDIKSSLKSVREYSSSPNGLGSFKSDKNEHLFLIYSVEGESKEVDKRIFNFTKGTFVRRRRLRLNVLNDPFCPRQVHKGSEDFFNLADNDSLSSDDDDQIDHLIFFIHGVGGVCDVRFRPCAEVVADFRKMANNLLVQQSTPISSGASTPASGKPAAPSSKKSFLRKQSTESSTSRASDPTEAGCSGGGVGGGGGGGSSKSTSNQQSSTPRAKRVECLPVSWHICMRRQTGLTDQFNLIALSSVPKLRHFFHKVVLDALLYSSGPVYNQTIINNVGDEINRLYTLFMEKHPNFNGTISLAGHSLGAVILFDLLANQIPQETELAGSSESSPATAEDQSATTTTTKTTTTPTSPTSSTITNDDMNVESNNNNNIESELVQESKSSRRNCRNLSHTHHELSTGTENCFDYKNLEELLKDMDLTQYTDLFQKEHIDLNTLLLLTDLDMKELNLSLGARRKLGTYINFKKVSITATASGMQRQQQNTQQQQSINSEINNLLETMNTGQYLIKYPQLKFKPRCFFAFGSPVSMFLNVRGIQTMSKEFKLPTCDRMFNIFHPYDPLAYRLEPLIDPRFKHVDAVQVPHHRGGKRMHVQIREGFARVGHDIKHRIFGSLRDTWCSFTRMRAGTPEPSCPPSIDSSPESRRKKFTRSVSSSVDVVEVESLENGPNGSSFSNYSKQGKQQMKRQPGIIRSQSEINSSSSDCNSTAIDSNDRANGNIHNVQQQKQQDSEINEGNDKDKNGNNNKQDSQSSEFDQTIIGRLNNGRRLDYVLQEKPIELFNEYIFAFTSHANYWQNEDSALIILNELYQTDNVQTSFDDLD